MNKLSSVNSNSQQAIPSLNLNSLRRILPKPNGAPQLPFPKTALEKTAGKIPFHKYDVALQGISFKQNTLTPKDPQFQAKPENIFQKREENIILQDNNFYVPQVINSILQPSLQKNGKINQIMEHPLPKTFVSNIQPAINNINSKHTSPSTSQNSTISNYNNLQEQKVNTNNNVFRLRQTPCWICPKIPQISRESKFTELDLSKNEITPKIKTEQNHNNNHNLFYIKKMLEECNSQNEQISQERGRIQETLFKITENNQKNNIRNAPHQKSHSSGHLININNTPNNLDISKSNQPSLGINLLKHHQKNPLQKTNETVSLHEREKQNTQENLNKALRKIHQSCNYSSNLQNNTHVPRQHSQENPASKLIRDEEEKGSSQKTNNVQISLRQKISEHVPNFNQQKKFSDEQTFICERSIEFSEIKKPSSNKDCYEEINKNQLKKFPITQTIMNILQSTTKINQKSNSISDTQQQKDNNNLPIKYEDLRVTQKNKDFGDQAYQKEDLLKGKQGGGYQLHQYKSQPQLSQYSQLNQQQEQFQGPKVGHQRQQSTSVLEINQKSNNNKFMNKLQSPQQITPKKQAIPNSHHPSFFQAKCLNNTIEIENKIAYEIAIMPIGSPVKNRGSTFISDISTAFQTTKERIQNKFHQEDKDKARKEFIQCFFISPSKS